MIYTVEISKQADVDLRSIYEYIAFTLLSAENAIRQLNRLEESIMGLGQMPERFVNMKRNHGIAEVCAGCQ